MDGLFSFLRVILGAFLHTSPENRKQMEPLLMEGCRTSRAGEAKVKPPVAATAWTLSGITESISICCMKTAMVLACVYLVFLSYVAVTYTPRWAEKLRLSPLFLLAAMVPLLGAAMIREQRDGCGLHTRTRNYIVFSL